MASRKPLPKPPGKSGPTHRLYQVTGDGDKSFWREIGAAWPNKDGAGFSLSTSSIPLSGRIVMRAITERPQAEGALQ